MGDSRGFLDWLPASCRHVTVAIASVLIATTLGVYVRAGMMRAGPQAVATRMRNVNLHIGMGIEVHVEDLGGRMSSRLPGTLPVLDDPDSYVIDIDDARLSMTAESVTHLMNNYVFAYPGAPLHESEGHHGER